MAVIIAENKTTQELINEFKNDPDVEYVQPNFIYYIQDVNLPNDADFSKLWGLHNVGQNVNFVAGINDVDIDWPETMEIFSGSTNGT
ncbi:MAG: hypothetical protein LBQ59_02260 [Candidatus Peribacteria bacterium]|jgi:hypothetical protein|nr:hypothetical protein [Candidatus Peribacteria bacterium]